MRKFIAVALVVAFVAATAAQAQWVRVYGGGGTASNFAAQ